MTRKNSRKYFEDGMLAMLPRHLFNRNNRLVKNAVSILKDYIPLENYIPSKIKITYSSNKFNLAHDAWNELVDFLKGKERLNGEEIRSVKFIEQEILRFASYRLEQVKQLYKRSIKYDGEENILSDFRQRSPKGVSNTCCYSCGKVLERHSDVEISKENPHYCTRKENTVCYRNRRSFEAKQNKEWSHFINKKTGAYKKPYCPKCGKLITYSLDTKTKNNFFHKGLPICEEHFESYRKSMLRNQKKIKIISSEKYNTIAP